EVEYPCRGRIQDVALEDLDTNNGHQRDDQPRRGFADPSANAVNRVQDALDVHPSPPLSAESENNKAPSVAPAEGCLAGFSAPYARLLGIRSEVVIEHHLTAHDGVLFPLRRPLGERELGFDDLLEQRIFRRLLLCDLVEDLELPFEHRIGCLVELHV